MGYDAKSKRKRRLSYCAICGCDLRKGADKVTEKRPSGPHFATQTWAYCPPCWDSMKEMREVESEERSERVLWYNTIGN